MPFTGKLIAVTGAASGIGLATARLLAQRGAALSLADINTEGLAKARALIESEDSPKSHILTTVLDVRDSAQVDSWIKRSTDKLGPLYGAANVAGVTVKQLSGDPLDAPDAVVSTPLTEKAFKDFQIPMILMSDMQRLAKPEEVANVIAFLLSQEASFVTGSTYPVDGGYLY
ncbi:hypothetical protein AtubIFM55763_003018 [Aspergillus tubingensis]|nr:hypothetical protein AtubIFM54640_005610 [Aspergillus tubingensis]GLA72478.1 hypothetical protein AtubIFM55763_003018 [Aspergillus tubingensis]GLB17621.1 hypothetical protein AtubIFM61612_007500 [Aspergillus tubingensis]